MRISIPIQLLDHVTCPDPFPSPPSGVVEVVELKAEDVEVVVDEEWDVHTRDTSPGDPADVFTRKTRPAA